MAWLYILIGVVALLLFYWGGELCNWRIGSKATVEEIDDTIRTVMYGGWNGAGICMRDRKHGRSLEFKKIIPRKGEGQTSFRMILRSKACSAEEFAQAQHLMTELGVDFEIEKSQRDNSESLVVECGRDDVKAINLAREILTRVFGLTEDSTFRGCVAGHINARPGTLHGWSENEGARYRHQVSWSAPDKDQPTLRRCWGFGLRTRKKR